MSSDHSHPELAIPPLPRDLPRSSEPPAPARGDPLDGRYQLQEPLGEGGTGEVFRALQIKVQRPLAVKFLKRESLGDQRDAVSRFEREALALAALCHPNIVRLQDYGVSRGTPFLVMELAGGRSLRQVIADEPHLPIARTLAFARQILHALAYAHDLGMVHRDLKPDNVVVQDLPQQPEHVKVLDFGFVKFLPGSDLAPSVQLTRAGFTYGSPAYMSPEHATGGQVDGRSDLYAVGIMLFEMFTGERPFAGEINELLRHHLATPVPQLAQFSPELAGRDDLQALIEKLLAKPRNERFANAGEVLAAIDRLPEGQGAAAAAATPTSPAPKRVTQNVGSSELTIMRSASESADPSVLRARAEWADFIARLRGVWLGIAGFFQRVSAEQGPRAHDLGQRTYVAVRTRTRPLLVRLSAPLVAAAKNAWSRVTSSRGDKQP